MSEYKYRARKPILWEREKNLVRPTAVRFFAVHRVTVEHTMDNPYNVYNDIDINNDNSGNHSNHIPKYFRTKLLDPNTEARMNHFKNPFLGVFVRIVDEKVVVKDDSFNRKYKEKLLARLKRPF